jgi:hypothetical protein
MFRFNIFFFLVCLTLLSCKKDADIGKEILPGNDELNVAYSDSIGLICSTLIESPQRTDNIIFGYFGNITDPVFGYRNAVFTSQVIKPTLNSSQIDGPFTLVGIYLNVYYSSIIGDSTLPQSFVVKKMSGLIDRTINRYSDYLFPTSSVEIGSLYNYVARPSDSIVAIPDYSTTKSVRLMQIPLESYFGYGLLNNFIKTTSINDTVFANYLSGISIAPIGNSGNCWFEPNYSDSRNGIYLVYKDRLGVTQSAFFPFGAFVHNYFQHDYTSGAVYQSIGNALYSDTMSYVAANASIKTKVEIPNEFLDKFSGKIINKAVLELTQVPSPTSLAKPTVLSLTYKNTSDKIVDVPDLSKFGSVSSIDSSQTDDFGNKMIKYQLNITNYLQQVLSGSITNSGLFITTYPEAPSYWSIVDATTRSRLSRSYFAPYGLVFAGPNYSDSKYRMRIKVIYSTY